MDDFRLTVFITAARTLSFTRTAERLGISQPAVSRHIGELEARYRVPLFVRRGGGLELTEAGCVLLDAAERVSDDYRRLEYEMGLCTSQTEGELRLGASTTVAQYLLPVILAHFTTRFPGVRVSMLSGNSGRIEQALADREIDLGLVESVSRRQGLHYTLFRPDELVLVARTGGAWAATESVTPAELCRIPLVLRESGSGTLEVIAAALSMGENNACMRRIVAAPTAGSCGVLPAVLLSYEEDFSATQEDLVKALYVAAGIGTVIAENASLAGASGGCQAEIGSASAMAAGALASIQGGDAETIMHAATLALKNMLGLVCDPVAGLVEVPCIKRNSCGAVNAVTSAQLALAGIRSAIAPDDVIDSMRRIGNQLPPCLKETSEGGLAVTESARAYQRHSNKRRIEK